MPNRINKVLVVFLAAVIILGIIIFWRYTVTKDNLLARERSLVELNERITKLTEERSGLSDQIHKNTRLLDKLKIENERLPQLEEKIRLKDRSLSELEKNLRRIETDLQKQKEGEETLRKELASKDAVVVEFQERLRRFSSVAESLKEEILRGHGDLGRLQDKLLALQEQKAPAKTKEAPLKSSYDAIISELSERMQKKAAVIAQLLARLESIESKTTSRADEGAKGPSTPELRQRQPSPPAEQKAEAGTQVDQLKSTYEAVISDKDAMVIELQEKLRGLSYVTKSLKEEIVRSHRDLDRLQDKLRILQMQKAPADTKEGRLKSSYDEIISELSQQMQNKAAVIDQLLARLESIESKTPSLKDEGAKGPSTPELRQRKPPVPQEQQAEAGIEVDQLKSAYEGIISDLNTQMQQKADELAELQGRLKGTHTEIVTLKKEIGKGQTKLAEFQRQVSRLHGAKAEAEMRLGKLQSTYDAMISELKEQIRNQEVMIEGYEERLSLSLVDRILFDFGKATLTQKGKRILTKVGKALRSVQGRRILVIGHTDNVPIHPKNRSKFPSNWELSAARSAAVVRFLQARSGLDPKSMEAVGRSLYDPIASNKTPKGRAQNRRVEIVIAPEIGTE